jgi:hypothetical protein
VLNPVLERTDIPVGTSLPATIAAHLPSAATFRPFPEGLIGEEALPALKREFGTSWLFTRPLAPSAGGTRIEGDVRQVLVIDESHYSGLLNLVKASGKSELFRVWVASSFVQEAIELSLLATVAPKPATSPAQGGGPLVDPDAGVRAALGDLVEWTGVSDDRLRQLVGAKSRSSFYNWLRGSTISSRFSDRIMRLHALIKPIRETRDRRLVAAWLEHGDPSPAHLIIADRWDEAAALAKATLRPAQTAGPTASIVEADEDEDALVSLLNFRVVPAAVAGGKRRLGPLREDTGLGDWSYEE